MSERTIERNGMRIAFSDVGSGPCIVLGHSFLCTRSMWRKQLPALIGSHRVVNVDFRGHGASGHIGDGFTIYDLVDDVIAVLDACGVERAVWAGLSVGGFVALRAAITHPRRVRGLILVDTDAGAERAWRRLKYRVLGRIANMAGLGPVMGQATKQMFGATARRDHPATVREWQRELRSQHVPSLVHFLDAVRNRDDVSSRLPGIEVPALVVVGTEDVSLPPDRSRKLAADLPVAELVEVEGAGHLSALECPEPVTEAMVRFLDSLPAEG